MKGRYWIIIGITLLTIGTLTSTAGVGHVAHGHSMEPELTQSDIYVFVPAMSPQPGDIIIFNKPHSQRQYIHSIVRDTPQGYITKGYANEHTDQYYTVPPITQDRVIAKIPQIAGHPVIIPGGYWFVRLFLDHWIAVILGTVFITLVLRSGRGRSGATDERSFSIAPSRVTIAAGMALLVVGSGVAYTAPSTYTQSIGGNATINTHDRGVASATHNYYTHTFTFNRTIVEERGLAIPVVRGVEGASIETKFWVIKVTIPLGKLARMGGSYSIVFYQYPETLPSPWIRTLHAIHPAVAAVGSVSALIIPLTLIVALLMKFIE